MMKIKKPELMAPIRDWTSLEACKDYADAVYFGCSDLSMRARANNITLSELPKFIDRCHTYKLKAYLTVNSVLYNNDLVKAEKIIKKAKQAGVDAVIVWDMAAILLAKKYKVPFFISTQANVSNWQTTKFFKSLGTQRVVLAREMTLKQIKEIKKKVKVEIETFVHGAMCVSISGRCILSAYLFNTSANCGACSQPCRKIWTLTDEDGKQIDNQGKYFLNPKDLCMIEYIPELIKAGIDSFKIEGRKRDPGYIGTVTKCYREAIDSYYNKTFTDTKVKQWKKQLANVYNRGFSTGFYFGTPSKQGISYDQADNLSPLKRTHIGKVIHYYSNLKVAIVEVQSRGLKLNDDLSIEGKDTYLRHKIKYMEKDNKAIKVAKKGDNCAIKLPHKVHRNNQVFIIEKK